MSDQKITFEQLEYAMNSKGLVAEKTTLNEMFADYEKFCSRCSNPNVPHTQKLDCGCGGPKVKPSRRYN